MPTISMSEQTKRIRYGGCYLAPTTLTSIKEIKEAEGLRSDGVVIDTAIEQLKKKVARRQK